VKQSDIIQVNKTSIKSPYSFTQRRVTSPDARVIGPTMTHSAEGICGLLFWSQNGDETGQLQHPDLNKRVTLKYKY
jgi:hypothetical protein